MGSIRKAPRTGRWEARYRDPGGRQLTRTKDSAGRRFETKADAAAWLHTVEADMIRGVYTAPDPSTVAEFLDEWLDAAAETLRPSTLALYRTLADAYVRGRIGGVKLQRLDALALNRLYAELRVSGARGGRPLGAETVAKVHRLLHRAFRDAERWGYLARNPAGLADPPRAPKPTMSVWNAEELARFLAHTADERDAALWVLLATTGLRRAEALGLQWGEVDLNAGQISVRRTLAYVGTRAVLSEPKTGRSRRLVVLPPDATAALRAHRRRQLEERLAAGADYEDRGFVFCTPEGAPLVPATVSRRFGRLARAAGLPRLTVHGLRHSFATLALKAGVPSKVVAEVLGHASARTTEDIYQHVTAGMQGDATARVAALLRS